MTLCLTRVCRCAARSNPGSCPRRCRPPWPCSPKQSLTPCYPPGSVQQQPAANAHAYMAARCVLPQPRATRGASGTRHVAMTWRPHAYHLITRGRAVPGRCLEGPPRGWPRTRLDCMGYPAGIPNRGCDVAGAWLARGCRDAGVPRRRRDRHHGLRARQPVLLGPRERPARRSRPPSRRRAARPLPPTRTATQLVSPRCYGISALLHALLRMHCWSAGPLPSLGGMA